MKLILPFPPSVNTYWRHPNKGAFAGKSLISAAGRKFQSAACAAIVEQLRRLPKPTSAPASVEIVLFPPDNDDVVKPVKEQAENKIDGAVALIMAVGRAMLYEKEDTLSDHIESYGIRSL
ncbi:phage holliday junction resolvase [Escherichia coli]|nr:phage holliday junction resolvase [Escherichia coli]